MKESRILFKKLFNNDSKKYLDYLFYLVLFCVLFLWSLMLRFNDAPDELGRYRICQYIFNHGKLPHGGDMEIRLEAWGGLCFPTYTTLYFWWDFNENYIFFYPEFLFLSDCCTVCQQGRYLLPMLVPFMYFISMGIRNIFQIVIKSRFFLSILITLLIFWSFIVVYFFIKDMVFQNYWSVYINYIKAII